MSMTLDRETAMLSAQKLRLMQRGNIVVLVSLAAILANAILSLVLALNNPFALMRGGIGTVSYTHLDVYKRQMQARSKYGAKRPKAGKK